MAHDFHGLLCGGQSPLLFFGEDELDHGISFSLPTQIIETMDSAGKGVWLFDGVDNVVE